MIEKRVDGEMNRNGTKAYNKKPSLGGKFPLGNPRQAMILLTRILWAFPIVKLRLIVGFKL